MALPSQGGFSSSRRGSMYRRRRRHRKVSWIIVIAAGVCFTWLVWPDSEVDLVEELPVAIMQPTEPIATPPELEMPSRIAQEPPPTIVETPVVEHTVVVVDEHVEQPAESISRPIPLATTTSANLEEGLALLDDGLLVEARKHLSTSLRSGLLSEQEAAQARGVLTDISGQLVFSRELFFDDPFEIEYIIQNGDTLSGIVQKMGLQVNWRFLQRINNIKQATSIRPGQNIKLISGPFHAIVHKDTYRIDLYLGDGDEQVFVRTYKVGLGEFNSTPSGLFRVRKNSKLINPTWVNPRTREFFAADNPENPIGERWIGLQGIQEHTKDLTGLGIHGTIDPQTIGMQSSMGCIRMHAQDVEQVYEMLSEGTSTIEIK